MPSICIQLDITAPIDRVFDLAQYRCAHGIHRADQRTCYRWPYLGLIELGERVTWEARHFGITQQLEVEITQFERPHVFEDTMIKGAFKSFEHQHFFSENQGITKMRDVFTYRAPLGPLGVYCGTPHFLPAI